ncbi:Sodium/potassium/calcium exchanger 2 [Trichostrongylus colubriformis]|uniref:Sodium/potassium/calcium exchanger 2 n=1 Tax=Trichostrongylus colubriformis TaxID=6319 RepID=A0AAN8FR99_TRICO
MRSREFQRCRRQMRRDFMLPVLASVAVGFGVIAVITSSFQDLSDEPHPRRVPRAALRRNECARRRIVANESSDQFPSDLFTLEQRRHGAIVLHLGGLVYMFVALAVVCDEFFVPSLSVLIEVFDISEDVAGATFMAAGGSAPEFFTSVFGVFVAQNNVGIGTIVGSATFNILCVLAFCTLFSREVLHLTWWPLFRDMTFYIIALFFLVIFFADEKISWNEALTMFLIYIIYGIFMKYNNQMEQRVKNLLRGGSSTSAQMSSLAVSSITDPQYNREHRRSIPMIHGGPQLRSGLAQMAIGSEDENEADQRNKEQQVKTVTVQPKQEQLFVRTNNCKPIKTVNGSMEGHGNRITPVNEDTRESVSSVQNGNARLENSTQPDKMSFNSNEEQPLDLSWPETPLKRVIYVLLAPITFPLSVTLPDVRKPSWKPWFAVTFIGSVLWIALFSYLMVWWANVIGETFAIPTEIMGLTILAAGTSIPDLITSVIVARKGLGDMAVSSSIGSNLFDICVGLPVPWILYFIIALFRFSGSAFPTVAVISNGLICSVGMLFLMLVFLVLAIALSRWKMDKIFGLVMIISYLGFCVFSVFLETGQIVCPLKTASDMC